VEINGLAGRRWGRGGAWNRGKTGLFLIILFIRRYFKAQYLI